MRIEYRNVTRSVRVGALQFLCCSTTDEYGRRVPLCPHLGRCASLCVGSCLLLASLLASLLMCQRLESLRVNRLRVLLVCIAFWSSARLLGLLVGNCTILRVSGTLLLLDA